MVVILKPTLNCNLKCKHCYIGDDFTKNQLSDEQLIFILKSLPYNSEVIIHGGEPTLLGYDFYNKILSQLTQHRYSIQSNLTLINEEWIEVLRNIFNGRVSSSYDVVGDVRPIDRKLWIEKVKLLQRNGINPYIVCVLSKQNHNCPEQVYSFFKEMNLSFRVNYMINAGRAYQQFKNLKHDSGMYYKFMERIFNLWFLNSEDIIVDPLMEIIESVIRGNSLGKCPFTSKCAINFISINPDGTVLPCGGFESFGINYGNVFHSRLQDLLCSEERKKAIQRIYMKPSVCNNCQWYYLCGGGCRLEAMSAYGDIYRETSMCGELKQIFAMVENAVDKNYNSVIDWYTNLIQKRNCYE